MADEKTMSYNHAWGGTIPFPKSKWQGWYDRWINSDEYHYFYRYLYDTNNKQYVGEVAYHFDEESQKHLCDVIVLAEYRGLGFGSMGIQLLVKAAKEHGVKVLYDDIAIDNPSTKLFIKNGFMVERKTDEFVLVKKVL